MGIRITTWNVNGIRNPFSYQPWRDKRTFNAMFDLLEADIVILQETKIQRKDLRDDMVLVPGWDCFFSLPRHEKGKFGVVIYTRQSICAPIRAEEGLTGTLCPPNTTIPFCEQPEDQQIGGYPTLQQAANAPNATELSEDFATLDCEGRCVVLEFPAFVLIGLYNPAARAESRNAFRYAFHNLLDIRIRNLVALGKRVVVAGDLNIIRSEIDMANAEADLRKMETTADEYFSMPSRKMFNQWLDDGLRYEELDAGREKHVLHDICRGFHPNRKGMFTCWETKINARPGNYGSRIDYVLCSLDMRDWFSDSNIQEGLMGSDHCPVYAILKDKIIIDSKEVYTIDLLNPPGMFQDGQRLREHSIKDMLPLSGKLIPEFCGRRSIKDMFVKKPSLSTKQSTGLSIPDDDAQAYSTTQDTASQSPTKSLASDIAIETTSPKQPSSITNNKRAAPSKSSSTGPPSKRNRSSANNSFESKTQINSQKSLKSFFAKSNVSDNTATQQNPDTEDNILTLSKDDIQRQGDSQGSPELLSTIPQQTSSTTSATTLQYLESPPRKITASTPSTKSWSALFSKPVAPLCEGHGEPCKTMLTKKPGVNCGRSFWMCAKPLGPSGTKEKGTEWRCGTFIWSSDWNGRNVSSSSNTNGNGNAGRAIDSEEL